SGRAGTGGGSSQRQGLGQPAETWIRSDREPGGAEGTPHRGRRILPGHRRRGVLRRGLTVFFRWLLASFHLLAFGIGLGAIWVRGRALRSPHDPAAIRRALRADIWWGVAALLWLATGLPRLFLGLEKPTSYYLHNHVFWLKMSLFLLIILFEMGP